MPSYGEDSYNLRKYGRRTLDKFSKIYEKTRQNCNFKKIVNLIHVTKVSLPNLLYLNLLFNSTT